MATTRPHRIISRTEVINLLADGKVIVIYKDNVLNLTSWITRHPGGDKAVYHMIGRDATDEMNAYHGEETIKIFNNWRIGKLDQKWENLLPPIQGAKYRKTVSNKSKSNDLEKKIDVNYSESASDLELDSMTSSASEEEEGYMTKFSELHIEKVDNKSVKPVVPQNILVNQSNKDEIFPVVKSSSVIVNPKRLMENYDNGLSQKDLLSIPSLDYETQQLLRDEYNNLHREIIDAGLYRCNYWAYVREVVKIGSLFLYSLSFLKLNWLFLSALFMGMAWHQGTFVAHDAGHVSLSHNYQIDNIFGIIIADWFGGLSLGWWKRNHNVHHLITNDPVHDPDIQHLPFFAVSVRLFDNVFSTYYDKTLWFDAFAQKLIPFQQYLYYPILCFGRFNLYRLSWGHIIFGEGPRKGSAAWFRYFEFAGLSFFFYWFFYLLVFKSIEGGWNRINYVMVSHMATMLVHVQITLSHFAMSTSDLGVSESFPSRQIRTTMDVDCPEWFDFFHGGLQFQAIHHLFPRLPRHNLRQAQPYVIRFCEKVGLSYSIYGFGEGNDIVIGKLADIGKQCSILLDATKKYDGDLF
ncbi:SLD [Candida pseudojiufengensis]|uniref:SLD n=1 Tax=Candida pseudojiufengensis TaxID=497109 RepID=UPI002224B7E7|nr:SLD [Candida pseudojiufengensis]KAI5959600.1 SLD [Candida pseudojiufengensis]